MCSSHLRLCAVAVLGYGARGGGRDSYPETGLPWKVLFLKWRIHSPSNMEPVLRGVSTSFPRVAWVSCHIFSWRCRGDPSEWELDSPDPTWIHQEGKSCRDFMA